nr:MAG TPA: hypothetical protein [Caudoviricetes sp.]
MPFYIYIFSYFVFLPYFFILFDIFRNYFSTSHVSISSMLCGSLSSHLMNENHGIRGSLQISPLPHHHA